MARASTGLWGIVVLAVLLAAGPADAQQRRRGPPRGGRIVVTSLIEGARVELDGKHVGTTPLDKPIWARAGEHELRVTKPGHLEFADTVLVRAGREVTIEADLLPFAGVLSMTSRPPGAEVSAGGAVLGTTPFSDVELKAGEHTLVASLAGHRPWTKDIEVVPGTFYRLKAVLEPGVEVVEAAPADDGLELVGLTPEAAAAAAGGSETALALADSGPAPADRGPVYGKWWFWTAAAAVVAAGVTTAALASGPRTVIDCTPLGGVDGHIGLGSCGDGL